MSGKIEVRANTLGKTPIMGEEYHHLYLVYTNEQGEQFYLRGGPTDKIASKDALPLVASDAMTDAPNDLHDAESPWGNLKVTFGEYKPGTVDYRVDAKSIIVSQGPQTKDQFDRLKDIMCDIEAADISYAGYSVNSNSIVTYALKKAGITPQLPDGVWAPGHDTILEIKDHVLKPEAGTSRRQACVPETQPMSQQTHESQPLQIKNMTKTEMTGDEKFIEFIRNNAANSNHGPGNDDGPDFC